MQKIDRTGETNVSNEGCFMKIVEYNNTLEEAFNAYKIAKENEVKRIANDCVLKGYITKDSRLYKAMITYQIGIDD